jgi:Glu-tRNA(Gln) amidotransferase subunit E-like FAD-binding protein
MTTNKLNLPIQDDTDSADTVKAFYDEYYTAPLSYPSNQVDAVVGFFEARDFDKSAAVAVASILLKQSKLDGINVFELLDTLKGLSEIQLSAIVTEVMNANRDRVSTIGFKVTNTQQHVEARNIIY